MPDEYTPPSGPPPSFLSNNPFRRHNQPATPAGPPPTRQQESYVPPPGPPPSHQIQEQYQPPSGPPPGYNNSGDLYTPPPGPPPPKHDWQSAVPDTSELPPPPSLFSGYDRSPANNATESDANDAERWLKNRPLGPPVHLDRAALDALHWGNIALLRPPMMTGEITPKGLGHWRGKTKPNSPDSICISSIPVYSVLAHSPLQTHTPKTAYFEVRILSRRPEVTLGLGFVAQPYPPFRLPGWERASLGVHGDDGHRYVNDKWGGRDFTTPFKPGQTLGIGMIFSVAKSRGNEPPAYGNAGSGGDLQVEVFFTRDGKKEAGWDMHEELDAKVDLPITGLEGMHDLYAAVGTFEDVEFEVVFTEKDWLYKPKVSVKA